jgi:hypothetical protein
MRQRWPGLRRPPGSRIQQAPSEGFGAIESVEASATSPCDVPLTEWGRLIPPDAGHHPSPGPQREGRRVVHERAPPRRFPGLGLQGAAGASHATPGAIGHGNRRSAHVDFGRTADHDFFTNARPLLMRLPGKATSAVNAPAIVPISEEFGHRKWIADFTPTS